MSVRLGVNIDHIATLRQARGEQYPSLVEGARSVLEAGAHQITLHLREDRRHIQDFDVPAIKMVTQRYGVNLNLEMSTNEDILGVAIDVKPDWVCIVPEKREEKTTEGGLDLLNQDQFQRVKDVCEKLRANIKPIKISLFVEAAPEVLAKCLELKCDAVEIHTGHFAIDFNENRDVSRHLEKYQKAYEQLQGHAVGLHAGHGLTDKSLEALLQQKLFQEYNIGHWIICQSLFNGLEQTTKGLLDLIRKEGK